MNTNKIATGSSSKKLLAALAVLAVAFVVLAAVPAVADTSDAADTATTTESKDPLYGIVYAGYSASGQTYKDAFANADATVGDGALYFLVYEPAGLTKLEYKISTTVNGAESYWKEFIDYGNLSANRAMPFVSSQGTGVESAWDGVTISNGDLYKDGIQTTSSALGFTSYTDGIKAGYQYTINVTWTVGEKTYTDSQTVSKEGLTAYKYNTVLCANGGTEGVYALTEGASVTIKTGASIQGIIKYTDSNSKESSIKFDGTGSTSKLGVTAASDVTITPGSIEIEGDITGNSGTATQNAVTLSGEVNIVGDTTIGKGVTVTIDSGAVVTVKSGATLYNNGKISVATAETLKFESGSNYVGALLTEDDGTILPLEYTEGSIVNYNGIDYTVFLKNAGSQTLSGNPTPTPIIIRFAVSDVTVEYTGSSVTQDEIERQGANIIAITSGYTKTDGTIAGLSTGIASYSINQKEYAGQSDPGTYKDVVQTKINWSIDGTIQAGQLAVYVALVISKIDISDMTITADKVTYTGSDLSNSIKFNTPDAKDTSGVKLESGYTPKYYSDENLATAVTSIINAGTYYAQLTIDDTNKYFTGQSKAVKVTVDKAAVTATLDPVKDDGKTIDATWNSETFETVNDASKKENERSLVQSGYILEGTSIAAKFGTTDVTGVTFRGTTATTASGQPNFGSTAAVKTQAATASTTGADITKDDIQTALDKFLASWTNDSGLTVYIQIAVTGSENIKDSTSETYTLLIGKFIPLEDYVTFDDASTKGTQTVDGVSFTKASPYKSETGNAYTYIASGVLIKDQTSKNYTFSFTATGPAKSSTLEANARTPAGATDPYRISLNYVATAPETAAHGQTLVTEVDPDKAFEVKAEPVANQTPNQIKITVTISKELAIEGSIVLNVTSTQPVDAVSAQYTIDLSGLVPQMFSIQLVEEDGSYATQTYKNYYTVKPDATGGSSTSTDYALDEDNTYSSDDGTTWNYVSPSRGYVYFTLGSYFTLPATAAKTVWKLASDGTTYNGDSVYTVAAKDIKKGVITFNASGSSSTTVDPADATYTVFYILDGKQTSQTLKSGEALTFPATENVTWTCDGETVDVSAGVSASKDAVYIGTTASSTEYSTSVVAALRSDSTGVYLLLIATDNKTIPTGKVTVSYDFTEQTTNPFTGETTTMTSHDSFEQEYTAIDGKAYAYFQLDFEGKAATNYSAITGASASFADADSTVSASAAKIAFSLPEIQTQA